MERKLLKEYYQLKTTNTPLQTKNGASFKLVYVDPQESTDSTFDNKDLMKKYGMEYLPYSRYIRNLPNIPKAWGWVVWEGSENEVYPLIKKFAEEIGSQETPPEGGDERTIEQVLSTIEQIKDVVMAAQASSAGEINGSEIIANAEEFKKKLAEGIGSQDTMQALAELTRFRMEMSKHMGHQLSFLNTLLVFLQKRDATDVRSKGEWKEMGYTPKDGAVKIVLAMPARFNKYYGAMYDKIVRQFLEKEGVDSVSELTPSQKRRLKRKTEYPDTKSGFKEYIAYDISDLIKGEGAEEFPENNFKWYDADSEETDKEKKLIDACIAFGKSIGVRSYEFIDASQLGGSRGYASSNGDVRIIDDKRNHGLLSTVIHETAHQIMHWEVVKTSDPALARFYRGGSSNRGTDIVEQEAELCSWIVLSGLGYENQQEHFNYLANWGMNVSNCANVFDSIMKVADFMYDGIINKLNV